MKKFFTLSVVFFLTVFILSSCRQDFTCACKEADGNPIVNLEISDTERNAEQTCNAIGETYAEDSAYVGAFCELE